ncbi:uncharacterized protein LOC116751613 [Phocoena sinus]|uniref:uncharacterized protein LOC116751613 n=1 Tax=Phocoena sinus TaxID=42100 RepID=UPI0013C4A06E|nr:uncharacterized protein LOC116751613 [Phocoena sinus]
MAQIPENCSVRWPCWRCDAEILPQLNCGKAEARGQLCAPSSQGLRDRPCVPRHVVSPHVGTSLSLKRREALTLATTWTDLENTMLSERSQTQKDTQGVTPLMGNVQNRQGMCAKCQPASSGGGAYRRSLQGLQLFCRLEDAHRNGWGASGGVTCSALSLCWDCGFQSKSERLCWKTAVPQTVQQKVTTWPSKPSLIGAGPGELKTHVHTRACAPMATAARVETAQVSTDR